MNRTRSYLLFPAFVALPLLGCGLEEITDGDGGEDAIPAPVQAAFDESCATNGSCHAGGSVVNLGPGASEAILTTMAPNGEPYVVFGDLEASYLARKMLGKDIQGARMPLSPQSPNDPVNVAIILGWIAGAEFADEGGDGDGDTTTGDGDGDGDMTCYAISPVPATPSFEADVWPTLEARCTAGCHENMATIPHMPDAAGAFASLVGVASSAGMNYVTADSPDESYVWHKLSATHMFVGGFGAAMPFGGQMCAVEMQTIYAWILTGAAP